MKKMFVAVSLLTFLICMVMVTTAVKADTLLPTNADFSGGTHMGNGGNVMPNLWDNWTNVLSGWGNPTTDVDYTTGGYVVAKINGTHATPGGFGVVFQAPRMSLAAVGIPEDLPLTIKFSADINDLIPGGGGPGAILKLECFDACGVLVTTPAEEYQIAVSGTNWANYPQDFAIPATTRSVNFVFGVSTGWSGPNLKASSFAFDNLRIGAYSYPSDTPALFPVPIMGGGAPDNNVISWANPEGTVNADVWLQVSTVPIIPSPDPRVGGTKIALNITEPNTALSILNNRYYYWVVDVNMGSYVVYGFTWDFQTAELPPTVNAGADQYRVATASPMTLTLNATAADDHGITTYAWTDITNPLDKDPATVVTIVSPTTEDTTVTLTNPTGGVTGYYQFTLTVTDTASQTTSDTVTVGVYGTCAAAAIADPTDPYDGAGDLNGDCKVDLYDFALFVDKWLDCDSLKRSCP